jgi:hypothetical protein
MASRDEMMLEQASDLIPHTNLEIKATDEEKIHS